MKTIKINGQICHIIINGADLPTIQKEVLEKLGGWANSKVLDAVYIRTPKQRVRDSLKIFDDYMYGVIRDTRTEKNDGAA